jgi:hypothetical protein
LTKYFFKIKKKRCKNLKINEKTPLVRHVLKILHIHVISYSSRAVILAVLALTAQSSLDENSILYLMKNIQQLSQDVAWEQPYPVRNQVGRYLAKQDANLPNSITEDNGGHSLCPMYSKKQLRRIARLSMRGAKYGHGGRNLKKLHAFSDRSKQIPIERAFSEEGKEWHLSYESDYKSTFALLEKGER